MAAKRIASAMVSGVLAVVLLGACSDDGDKVNSTARSQDPAKLDCANPNIPMGEWQKRCQTATPTTTATGDSNDRSDQSASTSAAPSESATTSTPEGATATPATTGPPAPSVADVGDTVAMTGGSDEVFDATLVQLVDPATPKDEYSKPDDGNRLLALQWRITNTGSKSVATVPAFRTQLVDDQGQVFEMTIGPQAKGVEFPTSVSIPPGESRLGFVTYEVPKATKIVKVEFEGGYGKPSGQWLLTS